MAMNTIKVMGGSFAKGTFNGTTPTEIKMRYAPLPATVWVRPTAGTVSVLYSVDEAVNYIAVTALTTASAYSDTVLTGPITNLKFVGDGGTAAGTWGVC
jgi:hypothetical protein